MDSHHLSIGAPSKGRFLLPRTMTNVREARDAALRAVSPYTHMNPEDIARYQMEAPTGRGAIPGRLLGPSRQPLAGHD